MISLPRLVPSKSLKRSLGSREGSTRRHAAALEEMIEKIADLNKYRAYLLMIQETSKRQIQIVHVAPVVPSLIIILKGRTSVFRTIYCQGEEKQARPWNLCGHSLSDLIAPFCCLVGRIRYIPSAL